MLRKIYSHVGKDITNKLFYLGYMVNNLLRCHLKIRKFDDREVILISVLNFLEFYWQIYLGSILVK